MAVLSIETPGWKDGTNPILPAPFTDEWKEVRERPNPYPLKIDWLIANEAIIK